MTRKQIVDKTIMEADKDRDGKISFEEFTKMVENTDVSNSMTLGKLWLKIYSFELLNLRVRVTSKDMFREYQSPFEYWQCFIPDQF